LLARVVDEAGAALIPELLAMARAGALPAGRVPAETGTAFPALRPDHGLLDPSRSAIELDRLVRACAGEIHAFCFFQGMKLVVIEATPLEAPLQKASPGTIVEIGGNTIRIATADGDLAVQRWLFLNSLHSSDELSRRLGMSVGKRVTANAAFE
jgi:methionyl-tRNA formyltransferase